MHCKLNDLDQRARDFLAGRFERKLAVKLAQDVQNLLTRLIWEEDLVPEELLESLRDQPSLQAYLFMFEKISPSSLRPETSRTLLLRYPFLVTLCFGEHSPSLRAWQRLQQWCYSQNTSESRVLERIIDHCLSTYSAPIIDIRRRGSF